MLIQLDEFVPVGDLVACAQALAVAALRWCGDAAAAESTPEAEEAT